MDIQRILRKLPHRYPILLVDRVLEIEKGVRIKALKNVTINEPFFVGHFPARPVMPGVPDAGSPGAGCGDPAHSKSVDTEPGRRHGRLLRWHRQRPLQAPRRPGDQLILEASIDRVKVGHLPLQDQGQRRWPYRRSKPELMCTMRKVGSP
jgi:3-hydroxyacyl-[acyl-carrier-protein] dehydratase